MQEGRTGPRRTPPSPTPRPLRLPPPPTAPRERRASRACCGIPGSIAAQPVAGAAHRIDQAVVAGGLERLAQAPDMDVYRALLDEDMIAPDLVEQLGARVD